MSLQTNALTTVSDVKTHLSIYDEVTDAFIEGLINSLSDYVEKYTGRKIKEVKNVVEYFDGDDIEDYIYLKNYPITKLTSVEIDTNYPWEILVVDTDYKLYDEEGMIYLDREMPAGKRNVRVTYDSGYASIPSDIELLCRRLVAKIINKRLSDGKANEGLGGANIGWADLLTADEKIILDFYSKVNV